MKDIVLKALARNVIGKKPGKFAVFFLDDFSLNVVSHLTFCPYTLCLVIPFVRIRFVSLYIPFVRIRCVALYLLSLYVLSH